MFALLAKEKKLRCSFVQIIHRYNFICILLFGLLNTTLRWPGTFSHLLKYFCEVMFRVASLDRPDPAQFQKINFVGSLMTASIATARGKHTKSETSHLKTRSEQWEKGVGEFTN